MSVDAHILAAPPPPKVAAPDPRRYSTLDAQINRSGSVGTMPMFVAEPRVDRRRRRTRESDLFEGAEAFDSLTMISGSPSGALLLTTELAPPQSVFSDYIIDKPMKKSVPIEIAREQVFNQMKKVNSEYMATVDKLRTCTEYLRGVSREIKSHRGFGPDEMRKTYMMHILFYGNRQEYWERETNRLKDNIDSYAKFCEFMAKVTDTSMHVNLIGFVRAHIRMKPKALEFMKTDTNLHKLVPKTVRLPQPDASKPIEFFIHPANKTGQVVQRFVYQIDNCYYPDVEVIADALYEQSKKALTKDQIIRLLFDIAWEHKQFPLAPMVPAFPIPQIWDMCPKVFNPPFLGDEWSLTTFSELSLSDWPLKTAVDELFTIMILTNPFDIAQKFYEIIQEIGRCVQRCLIRKDQDARNVEIDFDQLFVLMLICIFTTGLTDITRPMSYSYTFREYTMSDAHKVYAMSHMEGLCVHLSKMDFPDLRKKSFELLAQKAVSDPLGLLH